jgi:hypothetical protein
VTTGNRRRVFTHRIVFAEKSDADDNVKSSKMEAKEEMSEDEKWALKGDSCPLCKMALASPCIAEFKVFDTCLEKLKEKYGDEKPPDEEGMECFSGFHACMFANLAFFKNYVEQQEAAAEAGQEHQEKEEKEAGAFSSGEEQPEKQEDRAVTVTSEEQKKSLSVS